MADGHVGYVMPIGGVAAYREQVSVVGVGFDIACGNAAIRTDLTLGTLGAASTRSALARELADEIAGHRQLRHRPEESRRRCAGRSSAVRRSPRGTRCRASTRQATARQGARRSSAPSAAAITTSTCSSTRPARSGSASTSAAAASATPSRRLPRARAGRARGATRVPEREVLLAARRSRSGRTTGTLMTLAGEYAYAGREWVARKVVVAPRRQRAGARAQPSQLRLARRARRRRGRRRPQGRDAGVPRPAGLHRRLDGRRRRDRAGRRARTSTPSVRRCSATRSSRRSTAPGV